MNWSDLMTGDILIQPSVDGTLAGWPSTVEGGIFLVLENNLPCEFSHGVQNMRVFHIACARETVWTVGGTITQGYAVLRGSETVFEGG